MAEKVKTMDQAPEEKIEVRNMVELGKPYLFEGKEYTEIDMTGLDKLTVGDAVKAQLQLFKEQEVATAILCETTTAFARYIATAATGLPVEFFKLMPRSIWRNVNQAVREYLNAEENTRDHIVTLDKPYMFQDKVYESVDLSGLGDMTTMNESAAENRLAREGFPITENSTNYLFACVMASMATKLPEEFFTGLPLRELLKLKAAVNDASFFE